MNLRGLGDGDASQLKRPKERLQYSISYVRMAAYGNKNIGRETKKIMQISVRTLPFRQIHTFEQRLLPRNQEISISLK